MYVRAQRNLKKREHDRVGVETKNQSGQPSLKVFQGSGKGEQNT